jgi:hypothetical protein
VGRHVQWPQSWDQPPENVSTYLLIEQKNIAG